MNMISKTLLDSYQVRKSKAQKTRFIDWVLPLAQEWGYEAKIEKGTFGARNIVIGDIEQADIIFTAHYDTCARMPFPNFITPKCLSIFLVMQFVMAFALTLPAVAVSVLGEIFKLPFADILFEIVLLADLALMMLGPANQNTANDNTSGVATVLSLMQALPEEMRSRAAFVLFDLEEIGLFGSMSFASMHKTQMKDKLLINFDCVSDGSNILLVLRKGARKYAELLRKSYISRDGFTAEICEKGAIYPSDQGNFPCGVGVAALKKGKLGILYMDRIHTKRDTQFSYANIEYLVKSSIKLLDKKGTA